MLVMTQNQLMTQNQRIKPSNLGGLSSIIGANAAPMGLSALKTLARVFT